MTENINQLGQPVGVEVVDWSAPEYPVHQVLTGQYCRVEPLNIKNHGEALFEIFNEDNNGQMWTYLPYGPFSSVLEYCQLLEKLTAQADQQFYVIVDLKTERALGVAGYLRINPAAGSIEVGHISYSPLLQRTTIATEAMYLMMKKIFEAGYRRYEWKCNALNAPSRSSALRLGFQFEGIFRQAMVIDGRNRDTAWYSIIDSEWTELKAQFEAWLQKTNFDQNGLQIKKLNKN